jgi:XTP/dITP diphosphohydrolase
VPNARLLLASSNRGKLEEYRELAAKSGIALDPLPGFDRVKAFEEIAPTFAENAVGKALHYSRATADAVLADDSGLVVTTLGGAPGVRSSRYAGPEADSAKNIQMLLAGLAGRSGADRRARFVCVLALAQAGRILAVFSDAANGVILESPRGAGGFGYDPVFFYEPLGKTFAEIPPGEKNRLSHRGRAFAKLEIYLRENPL